MEQSSTNAASPDIELFSVYPSVMTSEQKLTSAEILSSNVGKIIALCLLGSISLSFVPSLESTKTVGLPFEITPDGEFRNSAIARLDLGSLIDSIYADNVTLPSWYSDVKRLLEQFRHLPDDWRGMKASRLNDAAYENAKAFLAQYGSAMPSRPFIYPTTKGDLAIEVGSGDKATTMIMRESDLVVLSSAPTHTSAEVVSNWDEPPGSETVRHALALADHE